MQIDSEIQETDTAKSLILPLDFVNGTTHLETTQGT